jgi:hypothetical protein
MRSATKKKANVPDKYRTSCYDEIDDGNRGWDARRCCCTQTQHALAVPPDDHRDCLVGNCLHSSRFVWLALASKRHLAATWAPRVRPNAKANDWAEEADRLGMSKGGLHQQAAPLLVGRSHCHSSTCYSERRTTSSDPVDRAPPETRLFGQHCSFWASPHRTASPTSVQRGLIRGVVPVTETSN